MAPQMVENLLKTDPLISQVMVLGDRSSHLLALITLDQVQLMKWAEREGIELRGPEEAALDPRVISLIRERIRLKNKSLAAFDTVRDFRILPYDFALGTGELTPTLKLRRKIVSERYRDIIEDMARKPRIDL